MILIAGTVRFPPENMPAARPVMERMITATRAEDGCVQYAFAEDVLDPGLIHISELWRDAAALDLHRSAAHMAAWRAAGAELGVHGRDHPVRAPVRGTGVAAAVRRRVRRVLRGRASMVAATAGRCLSSGRRARPCTLPPQSGERMHRTSVATEVAAFEDAYIP